MATPHPDPYQMLGIPASASDAELRAAYRRAVQRHHPDHNGGTAESARRFEAIQDAYARVRAVRSSGQTAPPSVDPGLDSRLAEIERELAAAREAKEQARRAARAAPDAADAARGHPAPASEEELGYVTTQDSFSKIFSDAATGLAEHLTGAQENNPDAPGAAGVSERVADLLDEIGARLKGEPGKR
ncbi:MAG: J domain-containing protein [Candidatus Dormibacteraeota bacterium]|nr:J domain-containing protein [Candidatus Dormibacteraeota bacterium]